MKNVRRFELYVDCMPIIGAGSVPIAFEAIVEPMAERGGDLRELVRDYLDKMPDVVIVSSASQHAAAFLEVAAPEASRYVTPFARRTVLERLRDTKAEIDAEKARQAELDQLRADLARPECAELRESFLAALSR